MIMYSKSKLFETFLQQGYSIPIVDGLGPTTADRRDGGVHTCYSLTD